MASFIKTIRNLYKTDTYQGTKNTYDWIVKAVNKGEFRELEIKVKCLFNISDITCSCQGIAEFIENAYGQADYDLVSMDIAVYSKDKSVAYIIVNSFGGIKISTESKVMLERIVNLLENTSLDETEIDDTISVTYVETQINNNGVIVRGDGNIVANDHSEIEFKKDRTKEESSIRKFWEGIIQNVTSNFIWYLLTLVAGAVCAYFAMK